MRSSENEMNLAHNKLEYTHTLTLETFSNISIKYFQRKEKSYHSRLPLHKQYVEIRKRCEPKIGYRPKMPIKLLLAIFSSIRLFFFVLKFFSSTLGRYLVAISYLIIIIVCYRFAEVCNAPCLRAISTQIGNHRCVVIFKDEKQNQYAKI